MELSKNNRFRTGSMVDIYHTPVYETNTIAISDASYTDVDGENFYVTATFAEDISSEQFGIGDLCAFGFGVGLITNIPTTTSVTVNFPQSMFPDTNVAKYVGSEFQNALFFLTTGRVQANFVVANYKEEIKQAAYGYAKSVYNLQTKAELLLAPIRMVDDGILNSIFYSKGFVLKSCNDEDYTPLTTFSTEFPLELSGTSIDPIFRRAYLKERKLESKNRRAKAKLTFELIG